MERLIGVCALAFSMSVFAQQGQPGQQEQEYQPGQQEQEYGYEQQSETLPKDQQQGQAHSQVPPMEDETPPQQGASEQPGASDMQRADEQAQAQRTGQEQARTQGQSQALQQLADEHDDLSTFVRAMQETGLADAVARGEYTAFAPTNEAFEATGKSVDELLRPENQEQLIELLRNHLIAEQVDAERAKQLDQALTVGGATLDLSASDGELTVNGAEVTETDIRSEGLIVHTIEKVLEPAEDSGAQQSAAGEQRGTESVAEQDESEEYEDQSEE